MNQLGHHLIVDLYGARGTDDIEWVRQALEDCVMAIGATLLSIEVHGFGDGAGVSGVVVLAESHISLHAWPERNYTALDVFVCGDLEPERCLPVLQRHFQPAHMTHYRIERGPLSASPDRQPA